MRIAILLAGALAITGCTTTGASYPVEVTRYRVDDVGRGTIALISAGSGVADDIEFRAYADAVGDALGRQGYTVVPATQNAAFVAVIGIQTDRRSVRSRSPVTLGLGGGGYSGGYGGGVGLGGGISLPIGRGKTRDQVATILSVKINQRAGDQGVWEGRAQSQEVRPFGTPTSTATASRIANALFSGFPGESGRTISVK